MSSLYDNFLCLNYVQWMGLLTPDPAKWDTITYKYDPYGRRIEKSGNSEAIKYSYDGDHVIAEYDGDDRLLRKYIYGPLVDEPVCMVDVADSNAVYYYHFDGLGSVVALSELNGAVIEKYVYDAFGLPAVEGSLKTVGNTQVFASTTTDVNRRAMPYTMPEGGLVWNISIYHEGGTGDLLLAVYDDNGSGKPGTRLGVTQSTPINADAGWQTVELTSSVDVEEGQTIWLAWVFENNPGIRYQSGTPGRANSTQGWSGGMPESFGSSTTANYIYSIYATYTTVEQAPELVGNPYMFTGRRFDIETGLYYYRARCYNPHIGRFMQTDPVGYDDGINWYLYCGNNPVGFVDPSGEYRIVIKWHEALEDTTPLGVEIYTDEGVLTDNPQYYQSGAEFQSAIEEGYYDWIQEDPDNTAVFYFIEESGEEGSPIDIYIAGGVNIGLKTVLGTVLVVGGAEIVKKGIIIPGVLVVGGGLALITWDLTEDLSDPLQPIDAAREPLDSAVDKAEDGLFPVGYWCSICQKYDCGVPSHKPGPPR